MSDTAAGPRLRRAVRRITEALREMDVAVVDFTARDAGLTPEVLEAKDEPPLQDGVAIIDETVEPTITCGGVVVSPGMIILRRGTVEREHTAGDTE